MKKLWGGCYSICLTRTDGQDVFYSVCRSHQGHIKIKHTAWGSVSICDQVVTFLIPFLAVSNSSNSISSRLEITEKQSWSGGHGTADISTDWASESASIQAELSTVYLPKMGAADFFVRRDCRYATLNLQPGLRRWVITVRRRGESGPAGEPAASCATL